MRLFIAITLGLFVLPLSTVQAEELTDSPQFRYRAHRTRSISRPSHRSVERSTRSYRSNMALLRRNFRRQLQAIEAEKDALAPEQIRSESPKFITVKQGHTPYYRALTRRHVRHLNWVNEFRKARKAEQGEGPLMVPEEETEEENTEE